MSDDSSNRGELIVLTAPSGAGKTTLCQRLLAAGLGLRFSVSYTTRRPRAGEQDGVHYHFVERAQFERLRDADELLEWAEVHGELYGTGRAATESALAAGHDLLLDIDVQGADQIQRSPQEAVFVFVMPPSADVLERRLRERGTDAPEKIVSRLAAARREMERFAGFDYLLVNDDLDRAFEALLAIVVAMRLRCRRQVATGRQILGTFDTGGRSDGDREGHVG